jgi:hypothetical protein
LNFGRSADRKQSQDNRLGGSTTKSKISPKELRRRVRWMQSEREQEVAHPARCSRETTVGIPRR